MDLGTRGNGPVLKTGLTRGPFISPVEIQSRPLEVKPWCQQIAEGCQQDTIGTAIGAVLHLSEGEQHYDEQH